MTARDQAIKRLMDLVLSSLGLAVLAPTLAMIALLVRMTSPGPALYRHRRIGRGGMEFEVLKFRSMCHAPHQSGPQFTAADDPRINVCRSVPAPVQARCTARNSGTY